MEKASGCISTMARILAIFLAALLVLTMPLSILANNVLRTFFSPTEMSSAVANMLLLGGGLREQLANNIISSTWFDQGPSESKRVLTDLSSSDRIEITEILFPNEWVKTQVQENIGIIIEWIESEETLPKLLLDLKPLRVQLQEGGAYRIAEILVDSWPPCTADQRRQLSIALQQDSPSRLIFCRPEGELRQQLIDLVDHQLVRQIENMPAEVSLLDEMNPGDNIETLDEIRRNLLTVLLLLRWMRLLPFLFLGLIMTCIIRSWHDLTRWWGLPLGLGALFGLVVILIGHGVGPGLLKDGLSQSAQPVEIQEPIIDAVWELLSSVLNRSGFQALVLFILAAIIFSLPFILKRKTPESVPEPPPETPPKESGQEIPPPPTVEPFNPETIDTSVGSDRPSSDVD